MKLGDEDDDDDGGKGQGFVDNCKLIQKFLFGLVFDNFSPHPSNKSEGR